MKYLKITLLLITFVFFGCENFKESKFLVVTKTPQELKNFFIFILAIISAHRGGSDLNFPENCIETFERNLSNHPTMIETDIAMTKDSVLILMHDDTFQRTSTGNGKVATVNHSEVKSMFLKDYRGNETKYKIPTLEDALVWGKGKVIYCLDVKRGVPYEKVVELIRKTNSEGNAMVITYNANQAAKMARLAPDLMLSVSANGSEDVERLQKMGVSIENCVSFVGTSEPSAELISYFKSLNVPIIVGTFGNIDNRAKKSGDQIYYDLFDKGIQVLSVNRNLEAGKQAVLFNKKHNYNSPYLKIQ